MKLSLRNLDPQSVTNLLLAVALSVAMAVIIAEYSALTKRADEQASRAERLERRIDEINSHLATDTSLGDDVARLMEQNTRLLRVLEDRASTLQTCDR